MLRSSLLSSVRAGLLLTKTRSGSLGAFPVRVRCAASGSDGRTGEESVKGASPRRVRRLDPKLLEKAQRIIEGAELSPDQLAGPPGLHGSESFRFRRKHFKAGKDHEGPLDREEVIRNLDDVMMMPPTSEAVEDALTFKSGGVPPATAPPKPTPPPSAAASGSGPAGMPSGPKGRQPDPNVLKESPGEGVVHPDHVHHGSLGGANPLVQQKSQNLASTAVDQAKRKSRPPPKSVMDFGLHKASGRIKSQKANEVRDKIMTDIEAGRKKDKRGRMSPLGDRRRDTSVSVNREKFPLLDFGASETEATRRTRNARKHVALSLSKLKRRILSQSPLSATGSPVAGLGSSQLSPDVSAQSQQQQQEEEEEALVAETVPVAVQLGTSGYFSRALDRFPVQGRSLCFAYGSGVFRQAGQNIRDNVTDVIIVVENAERWHRLNLMKNRRDYSTLLQIMGARTIGRLQEDYGARMFFNTLVPFEGGLLKYGVISRSAFLTDCLDWEYLYSSGRLHKPVRLLEVDANREWSALHTALLLLPETFTEENLYLTLAGLSYTGDFRMVVGEDKNKVSNIVRPNLPRFRQLYAGRLRALSDYVDVAPARGRGDQDTCPAARHFHLTQLPRNLQWHLVVEWNKDGRYRDVEEVLRSAAYDRDSEDIIRKALAEIIARTSVTQAAKGIVTAGALKTIRYSSAKLRKMFKSMWPAS